MAGGPGLMVWAAMAVLCVGAVVTFQSQMLSNRNCQAVADWQSRFQADNAFREEWRAKEEEARKAREDLEFSFSMQFAKLYKEVAGVAATVEKGLGKVHEDNQKVVSQVTDLASRPPPAPAPAPDTGHPSAPDEYTLDIGGKVMMRMGRADVNGLREFGHDLRLPELPMETVVWRAGKKQQVLPPFNPDEYIEISMDGGPLALTYPRIQYKPVILGQDKTTTFALFPETSIYISFSSRTGAIKSALFVVFRDSPYTYQEATDVRQTLDEDFKQFIIEQGLNWNEGHTSVAQFANYRRLAMNPLVERVCEIGFNAGHSSIAWLTANDKIQLTSFDLQQHAYSDNAEKWMRKNFGDRWELVKGSSFVEVPQFHQKDPSFTCDILVVDGDHSEKGAYTDIKNMAALAHSRTLLVVDDCGCGESCEWCVPVETAYQKAEDDGIIEHVQTTVLQDYMRCWKVAYYRNTNKKGATRALGEGIPPKAWTPQSDVKEKSSQNAKPVDGDAKGTRTQAKAKETKQSPPKRSGEDPKSPPVEVLEAETETSTTAEENVDASESTVDDADGDAVSASEAAADEVDDEDTVEHGENDAATGEEVSPEDGTDEELTDGDAPGSVLGEDADTAVGDAADPDEEQPARDESHQ